MHPPQHVHIASAHPHGDHRDHRALPSAPPLPSQAYFSYASSWAFAMSSSPMPTALAASAAPLPPHAHAPLPPAHTASPSPCFRADHTHDLLLPPPLPRTAEEHTYYALAPRHPAGNPSPLPRSRSCSSSRSPRSPLRPAQTKLPTTSDNPPASPHFSSTLWQDEKTICFQVNVRGVLVARRSDNDMVNGTKLLNLCRLTRGKRDSILKNQPVRCVVKTGTLFFKGVWIEFDRARALAVQYHILPDLYPLFEDKASLRHISLSPENVQRTAAVLAAARQYNLSPPPCMLVFPPQDPTAPGAKTTATFMTTTTAETEDSSAADRTALSHDTTLGTAFRALPSRPPLLQRGDNLATAPACTETPLPLARLPSEKSTLARSTTLPRTSLGLGGRRPTPPLADQGWCTISSTARRAAASSDGRTSQTSLPAVPAVRPHSSDATLSRACDAAAALQVAGRERAPSAASGAETEAGAVAGIGLGTGAETGAGTGSTKRGPRAPELPVQSQAQAQAQARSVGWRLRSDD